ncbi:hypothetical protein FD755_020360 [Muntiacus reevesi]|uniref:Immunoglobulin domain-containing protein n=1 Tax=Muntiacus reevesi TaxID=9886 RepID=A0A5N3X3Q4_MUNRE|nr:hypothetical protein FD755_020360 [Muntiacus reevesi]
MGACGQLWVALNGELCCLSLSGPSKVTGIVGGSLSVECRYEEEFINNSKYWCKFPCMLLRKIVETKKPEREARKGRVSIKDHPANLTFTVTLESLREEDAGTYRCGIDVSLSFDPTFNVEVAVIQAPLASPTPRSTRPAVTAKTSTITAKVSTVSFTTLATKGATHSSSSQEEQEPTQSWRLHALLISLVFLLLLLGGVSLLAWRMVQRRVKAGEKPELPQSRNQAAGQAEPCYANLELQTRPLSGKPIQPTRVEVEYSTVKHELESRLPGEI